MGPGFLLVALYYGGATAIGLAITSGGKVHNIDELVQVFKQYQWSFLLIMAVAWAYWLYCVYAFYKVLADVPGWKQSTTPGKAVLFHFIPGYNLFWLVKWPSQIADFVNWRTQRPTMYRWLPGALILVGVALRFIEAGLGTILIFSVGVYLSRNIKRALLAPPLPGEGMPPDAYDGSLNRRNS